MLLRIKKLPTHAEKAVPAPFIVGTGRCGSTLLRLMLDSHSLLCIPPETHFISHLLDTFSVEATIQAEAFIDNLKSHYTWSDFHLSEAEIRNEIDAPYCDVADGIRAFYRCYGRRQRKPRWGDKTPDYLHCMSGIQAVLPEAHFIHLIRDCRDVVLSVKNLWFGPNDVEGAAKWWTKQIRKSRTQAAALDNYYEIRYEDLVTDPEGELTLLMKYLDLNFEPGILDYDQRAGDRLSELSSVKAGEKVVSKEMRLDAVRTATRPPQPDRIGRWRREMSDAEVKAVNEIAGDMLSSLGYVV